MLEQGSIPDAGQQPAGVVGLSPIAPAWRTDVGCLDLIRYEWRTVPIQPVRETGWMC